MKKITIKDGENVFEVDVPGKLYKELLDCLNVKPNKDICGKCKGFSFGYCYIENKYVSYDDMKCVSFK